MAGSIMIESQEENCSLGKRKAFKSLNEFLELSDIAKASSELG
jgi:hypothetical protein